MWKYFSNHTTPFQIVKTYLRTPLNKKLHHFSIFPNKISFNDFLKENFAVRFMGEKDRIEVKLQKCFEKLNFCDCTGEKFNNFHFCYGDREEYPNFELQNTIFA